MHEIESKWQAVWERLRVFEARDDGSAPRRYLLTMFPYPSGDLHMGHAEVFALADVVARYWRLRGFDVLFPIGWDSFGLPAENAAIRRGEHPATFTYDNIETQARSLRRYGVSFDWTRRLHTSDPEYLRWTQWLFLTMHERGLAYRAARRRELVPAGRHRAGQRAGGRRPVRAVRNGRRGAGADAVVPAHHAVRRPADRRHEPPGGRLATSTC